MKILEANEVIEVPEKIAVCPYCGNKLIAICDEWVECDDLTWQASSLSVDCLSEPEMEENIELWKEWFAIHSEMPYVYMLPIEQKILAWVNSQFRWKL